MDATTHRRALIARQLGLITRAQALRLDFTDNQIEHRLKTRAWFTAHPGVYRSAEVRRTWEQDVLAAILAAGPGTAEALLHGGNLRHGTPDAVAAFGTCGKLFSFDGVTSRTIELLVPNERRILTPDGAVVHRTRAWVPSRDLCVVQGIPRTTPLRTIVDLSAVLHPLAMEAALDSALRRGAVRVGRVWQCLDGMGSRGRPGTTLLRELLRDRAGRRVAESPPEIVLRRVLLDAGFPPPEVQHDVHDTDGRFIGRIDLAYPDARVGVEFDGYVYHTGKKAWIKDKRRRRRLDDLGWQIREFISEDLEDGSDGIVVSVSRALELQQTRFRAAW